MAPAAQLAAFLHVRDGRRIGGVPVDIDTRGRICPVRHSAVLREALRGRRIPLGDSMKSMVRLPLGRWVVYFGAGDFRSRSTIRL